MEVKRGKKILVMGLPSSGKTHIARMIANEIDCQHYDADIVRAVANDWEFCYEGRRRQAQRMAELAVAQSIRGKHVVCSFIAPTEELRRIFKPDILVYCTRTATRHYESTNAIFKEPTHYDANYTGGNSWDVVREMQQALEVKGD